MTAPRRTTRVGEDNGRFSVRSSLAWAILGRWHVNDRSHKLKILQHFKASPAVRDLLTPPYLMPSRLSLLLSLCSAVVVSASAVACTSTVIETKTAPAPTEDAGTDPPQRPPPPEEDGGTDPDPPAFVFKPAPPGTFAQAISAGGSVVKNPKVVPIVFANDPQKDQITDFTSKIATSSYWGAISSEYGVGALTAKAPIVVSETVASTITDQQIDNWLVNKFSTDARFGTPESDTLYAIYYPPNTVVDQGGGKSCEAFGGYHFETQVGATPISYAVMPRCASFAGFSGIEVTTFAASHEMLEWATDPYPASRPAYMTVDDDHAVWARVFLGELGDLCTQMGDVSTAPADLGFTVQRTWSNASAKAGHHPCAPTPKGSTYFTAFPAKLDTINVRDDFGRSISTKGLKIPVGQKKTIDLTMYSDAAITSWTVQVVDLSQVLGGQAEFSYSLDKSKGTAGDTLHLTITAESPAQAGQGFLLYSQHGGEANLWPVWVTN